MLVEMMQQAGFTLDIDGDQLKVTGHLNDNQRQFIRAHKTELLAELSATNEQMMDNTLDGIRASQPEGWGWWGYLLADGQQGSIRGPYPDRASVMAAVHAEFGQPAIKLNPLPGSLPAPG